MIPNTIKHNGELFVLKSIATQQIEAKRIANKIRKMQFRFRIKYFDNKYCVYKEVK